MLCVPRASCAKSKEPYNKITPKPPADLLVKSREVNTSQARLVVFFL